MGARSTRDYLAHYVLFKGDSLYGDNHVRNRCTLKRQLCILMARIPKNYRGSQPTGRQIKDLLPKVLQGFEKMQAAKLRHLVDAWPEIIGSKLAPMTRIEGFEQGTVKIKVTNSTLLSLLSGPEKNKILTLLRKRFPGAGIAKLHFFIG